MLKKGLFLLLLFIVSCSGEKYDTSKAIYILPSKTETFIPNSSLKNIPVRIEEPYYIGELKATKIADVSGISSNFEFQDGEVFYVKKNKTFVYINSEGKRSELSFAKILNKKNNIKSSLLTVEKNNVIITTNNGDVIAIDTMFMKLKWSFNVRDVITVKPVIHQNKAIIPTSSGAVFVFDLATGKLISEVEKSDDPLGINFNLLSNLKITQVDVGNFFVSYYKNNLLFFDLSTISKIYNFSLTGQSLSFAKITTNPVFYKNTIFSATSSCILALSLVNGIKIWEVNGDYQSNLIATGDYIFVFEKTSNSIVALSSENGDIKWVYQDAKKFKTSKQVWFFISNPNILLVINKNGYITKLNISNGSVIEERSNQRALSPLFNYTMIENKIYYVNKMQNLIVLQ